MDRHDNCNMDDSRQWDDDYDDDCYKEVFGEGESNLKKCAALWEGIFDNISKICQSYKKNLGGKKYGKGNGINKRA